MSLSQHTSLDSLLAFIRPTTTTISHGSSSISTSTAITRSIGLLKTGFVGTQHFFTNLTLKQIFFLIVGTSSALYVLSPTLVDCILYLTSPSEDETENFNKNNKNSKKMMLVKRKKKAGKYTVGLVNPANDCFANSNLQALASLRLLYGYISTLALAVPPDITDMKRADESPASSASSTISSPTINGNSSRNTPRSSVRSNPKGIENSPIGLTLALGKTVLALNEPVLVPKSLSPWPFLRVIETFYNSHISRNQHDAHELLHLILESLEMEHERVSKFYTAQQQQQTQQANGDTVVVSPVPEFPFKGTTIDKITCSKCGYSPTTSSSTFIVFSLMVPQKKSAHLTDLLNEVSSPEHIKDYGCVKCRVNHVLSTATATGQGRDLAVALTPYADQRRLAELPDELEAQLPRNITSPISKSMQFGKLPAILAIHLSRSIYGGYGASRNSCKVTVVETIELWENVDETDSAVKASSSEEGKKSSIEIAAALLGNRRKVTYRLVAMIRHKGTHHAGHYECFRRKNLDWWIDHLPKSKPASSASSVSTTNNSTSTSRRNSTSNGIDGGAKAEKTISRKTVTGLASASPESADENQDSKLESVVNTSSQLGSMVTNAAPTASPTPAVITLNTDKFSPMPENCKGESSKLAASVKQVTLSQEDYDEENHGKLPFPQANRTTPLATSKIDVTTDKKQLTYSSSSSSVVSLVAQAQQAQQQPKQQQPPLKQQQNQQYRSSQYPTQQGTAVTRHFGPDVAPPSQYEWWKISDEKTWECSTRDVLKEESGAYLLFYERI